MSDSYVTKEDHKEQCSSFKEFVKEYVCLKLKPLNTRTDGISAVTTELSRGQSVLRNWIVIILLGILGSGAYAKYTACGHEEKHGELTAKTDAMIAEHVTIREEMHEMKEDLNANIDKVETNINKRLDNMKKDILRELEEIKNNM